MAHAPRATRVGRLSDYLRQMCPPVFFVPLGFGRFFTIYFGLQALNGARTLQISWRAIIGASTIVVFTVLQRVYDEMKDCEHDIALAKAGDRRYANRPLVTGHVKIEDIKVLRWWVTGLLVALNLPLGFPLPFSGFAVTFVFFWFSLHWFFWPPCSKSLLLATLTHNPHHIVYAFYAGTVYVRDFSIPGVDLLTVALVVCMWMPMTAWEFSRKIRCPEDETAFQTYSKVFGWRWAPLPPTAAVLITMFSLFLIREPADLGWIYPGIVTIVALVTIGAYLRFRVSPTIPHSFLKPYSEVFVIVMIVGLPLTLLLRHRAAFVGGN